MKLVCIGITIMASILALTLSVLSEPKFSVFSSVAALVFGIIAFSITHKTGTVKKTIQFAFFITIIALGLSTYNIIF